MIEQQSYEIEIAEKEEIEGDFSPLHTSPEIDMENESKSAALDENFESNHEIFLDTFKCEPVSSSKLDFEIDFLVSLIF